MHHLDEASSNYKLTITYSHTQLKMDSVCGQSIHLFPSKFIVQTGETGLSVTGIFQGK